MITKDAYLQNPCGELSVPFWKWHGMTVPSTIKIVHQRDYVSMAGYTEDSYFRLKHDLREIPDSNVWEYSLRTAGVDDIPLLTRIINASYEDLAVTQEQLYCYTKTMVYEPSLWLVAQNAYGEAVGAIICDLDRDCREGIIEWLQVIPNHRKKGVGRLLVTQALKRMIGKATFATVSGKCENTTKPESLYRSCGFEGTDVWCILRKI